MMSWRTWVVTGLAAALAGCVTATPPHNLSAESVRALRLERVDLIVNPTASVYWPALMEEWTKSKGVPAAGDARASRETTTEGLRAHIAAQLREKARTVLEPPLRSTLAGTRPVIARMTINHIYVPTLLDSVGPTIMWGPGHVQSVIRANVDVVDARTGSVVLSFPDTVASTQGGYKLDIGTSGAFSHDPIERLMSSYRGKLEPWLLKG